MRTRSAHHGNTITSCRRTLSWKRLSLMLPWPICLRPPLKNAMPNVKKRMKNKMEVCTLMSCRCRSLILPKISALCLWMGWVCRSRYSLALICPYLLRFVLFCFAFALPLPCFTLLVPSCSCHLARALASHSVLAACCIAGGDHEL